MCRTSRRCVGSPRLQPGVSLVALLWIALAVNYVDRQMAYSMFPSLKADLGFTDAQLGLIGSIFGWVYSVCMPVAGRMADVFSRSRMIVASLVLWSAATLGCSLSGSVPVFLIWRAVMGVTEALYYPAAVGLIAAFHPGPSRSKALGIHQSAQFAGLVAGGWYGGWMADHVSWRAGFGVAAVVGILYAAVLAGRLPQQPIRVPGVVRTGAGAVALLRSPCYLALCAAFFAFCAMLWVFYAWYPNFLFERYHLSMTDSGFNATIFVQVSCGAGVVAGGILADRLSRRIPAARLFVAAAGILLSAPFGYLTFSAPTLDAARACSAAYGAFAGLMIANIFAAAYDVVDARAFGFAAGVLNMVGGFSAAAIIFLAGLWKNTLGFDGLMRWVAVGCWISALALVAVAVASFRADHQKARAWTAAEPACTT